MAAELKANGESLCRDNASVRAASNESRNGFVASFGNILRFTGMLKKEISWSSHCASPPGERSIMVLRACAAALPGVVLSGSKAGDVMLALLPALLKGGRAERRREGAAGTAALWSWTLALDEGIPSIGELGMGVRLGR